MLLCNCSAYVINVNDRHQYADILFSVPHKGAWCLFTRPTILLEHSEKFLYHFHRRGAFEPVPKQLRTSFERLCFALEKSNLKI